MVVMMRMVMVVMMVVLVSCGIGEQDCGDGSTVVPLVILLCW